MLLLWFLRGGLCMPPISMPLSELSGGSCACRCKRVGSVVKPLLTGDSVTGGGAVLGSLGAVSDLSIFRKN